MKILTLPRAGGKTTAALTYLLANPNAYYVSHTRQGADSAFRQAKALSFDLDKSRFISVTDTRDKVSGSSESPVLVVDNVDIVLMYLLGARVELATMTGSTEE